MIWYLSRGLKKWVFETLNFYQCSITLRFDHPHHPTTTFRQKFILKLADGEIDLPDITAKDRKKEKRQKRKSDSDQFVPLLIGSRRPMPAAMNQNGLISNDQIAIRLEQAVIR